MLHAGVLRWADKVAYLSDGLFVEVRDECLFSSDFLLSILEIDGYSNNTTPPCTRWKTPHLD